ncbi:MAG: B12-binding domain-containing radical SAM protein [Myxococcota bacterium]
MQVEPIAIETKGAGDGAGAGPARVNGDAGTRDGRGRGGRRERVLLTTPFGPYETRWGEAPTDLLGARLARGDDILRRSSHLPTWALHLIAENVSNPCTVLEFPAWDDFVRELGEGYDVVAIELKSIHMRRVVRMMRAVRERSPGTRIVIGGYGVGALRDGMPGDEEGLAAYVLANADHLCRSEGVRFMRELLGDAPYDRPITQYHLPHARVRPMQGHSPVDIRLPAILVSLGCPSACDFCNTSAFFHHKKQTIATPAQVYDFMKHHQKRLGEDRITFILFDEDIFLDPEYVRELGRLIRSDPATWGFRWISFGSIGALQQYTPRELRECGVEGIWIGVESSLVDHGSDDLGYSKRGSTEPTELFAQLRQHGIQTIASMILGLDFHTPDNIEQDIEYFVGLEPTFYQIGPIRPCPGTKLYRQMRRQGRLMKNYDWEHFHLWEEISHKPLHFEQGGIRPYYDLAHERLRAELGSPVVQIFQANLLAHETFRDADTEFLRFQAELSLQTVRRLAPIVQGLAANGPAPAARTRARDLLARAERHLREDGPLLGAVRAVVGRVLAWRMGRPQEMEATPRMHAPDPFWAYFDGTGAPPCIKTRADRAPRALAAAEETLRADRTQPLRRLRRTLTGNTAAV